MTVYTLEDLQAEGLDPEMVKTRLQINCFSGTFLRDRDFPKRFKDEALKIVENYLDSGTKSFIVETALYVTVWKEEKKTPETPPDSPSIAPENKISSSAVPSAAAAQETTPTPNETAPAPKRKIIRKYRGQEYIIED